MKGIFKIRGVRGAASLAAFAAIFYLLVRLLLHLLVGFFMGLSVPGASLSDPLGFSSLSVTLISGLVGVLAIVMTVGALLYCTQLVPDDLHILLPLPWSPLFCLCLFLGFANGANLLGGLLGNALGLAPNSEPIAAGGAELFAAFLTLCIIPAITEEVLFRGALQGLFRSAGSGPAILAPAILFGLLHLNLIQGLTAFACGLFLGWLAERTGSILPGILLHFINNCLAFLNIYTQMYAPPGLALTVQLLTLLGLPLLALVALWKGMERGFRFSAGLRPGAAAASVFSSPAYLLAVFFLFGYCGFLTSVG